MNLPSTLLRTATFFTAILLAAGSVYAQVPQSTLDSIFTRLNGDDFDARYEARIELQDFVTQASSPTADAKQRLGVEAQLLDRLQSEPLVTTKLWIIRQLDLIGGKASVPVLTALADGEEEHLAIAATSVLDELPEAEGNELVPMEEPLLPNSMNRSKLMKIALEGGSRSVRFEAFSRLLENSPNKARKVFKRTLQNGPSTSQTDYIGLVMSSEKSSLRKTLTRDLATLSTEHQIVVLAGMDADDRNLESTVVGLLEEGNETLNTAVYAALGRIGSYDSFDVLMEGVAARSRTVSETAAEALSQVEDPEIDKVLQSTLASGTAEERVSAIEAMSLRAVPGTSERLIEVVSDRSQAEKVREEAIAGLEVVGTVESLPVLISIVVSPEDKGIKRDAQRALKRMTLRLADPQAAWAAFKGGLDGLDYGSEAQIDLLRILDSAPTKEAVTYLLDSFYQGDESVQATVLRVLPAWRNWDGGEALLEIAAKELEARDASFSGVGKLILGSNMTYPMAGKFALADQALSLAKTPEERIAVIEGFRYSTWRERVWVGEHEVDPELREAVLEYAVD